MAAGGLLLAILTGAAAAAVLAAPWIVVLVLGVGRGRRPVSAHLELDHDRVVAGGAAKMEVTLFGVDGWVDGRWRLPRDFAATGQATAEDQAENQASAEDQPAGIVDSDAVAPDAVAPEVEASGDVADRSGQVNLHFSSTAPAWGTHDLGRISVEVHHPFGLTVARGQIRKQQLLRVHPRAVDLRRLVAPIFVRRLSGVHRSRDRGRGVEYSDIRPFSFGDTARDINWRASARSDGLLVTERHPDRSTHVVLLLDSFIESGHQQPAVLAEAIEAAIALAESHLSASDRVGLIELGGIIRWVEPGTGRRQLERLVDALLDTRLYHSEAERPITLVPARVLPPRSFVLALSPLQDRRSFDNLLVLRRAGHDVAVVELPPAVDPASPRWDRTDWSRVALRLWRAEREMNRDRLIGQGIAVVGREPGSAEPWDQLLARLSLARRRARSAASAGAR